jgi:hypothetical protein
LVQELEKTS